MSRKIVQSEWKQALSQELLQKHQEAPKPKAPEPSRHDIAIDDLAEDSLLILYREIKHMLMESSGGPLSKESSQSLVNYVKLLNELKKQEKEALASLSDEQLEKLYTNKSSST